jgi:hypothetical protein
MAAHGIEDEAAFADGQAAQGLGRGQDGTVVVALFVFFHKQPDLVNNRVHRLIASSAVVFDMDQAGTRKGWNGLKIPLYISDM